MKPRKAARILAEILRDHPRALEVLHKHGVHLCAGCLLTLTATPEKVAAYHAVPDEGAFLRDLRQSSRTTKRRL